MAYFRRRVSPIKPEEKIDYKDVDLLRKFITERGKILPRRITGVDCKAATGSHCCYQACTYTGIAALR